MPAGGSIANRGYPCGGRRRYGRAMLSVEQAVSMLRREIQSALAADRPLPGGVTWSADRISLSLGLRFQEPAERGNENGQLVVATGPGDCVHHLTIDFKLPTVPSPQHPSDTPVESPAPALAASGPTDSSAFAALAQVFGVPGFDSSARATVFRETLEDLSEAQSQTVLRTLGKPSADEEPAVARARHLILRLAGKGPAGPERGPELLRQLAGQAPVPTLIRLAAERWRTQSEWAATSVTPE